MVRQAPHGKHRLMGLSYPPACNDTDTIAFAVARVCTYVDMYIYIVIVRVKVLGFGVNVRVMI